MITRSEIEMRVADMTFHSEKHNAAALGHDRLDVTMLSFGAFCGVLLLAHELERPTVLTKFRPMR